MPPREIAPFSDKPVGAGRRQPTQRADFGWGEPDTIMHFFLPPRVIGASAGRCVKKLAANVGEIHGAAIRVFQLDKAAAAASVTETFPFRGVELFERLLVPKVRGRRRGVRIRSFRRTPCPGRCPRLGHWLDCT